MTSVPSSTPSEFQRQLASLSHQPFYNFSSRLDSEESHDMATPPPHSPSPPLPPSPKFITPADHTHQPWFEDPFPLSPIGESEDRSSSSDEGVTTHPLSPPPVMATDYREGLPGFFLREPSLSLISEGASDSGQHPETLELEESEIAMEEYREEEERLRRISIGQENEWRWRQRREEELEYLGEEVEHQSEMVKRALPVTYLECPTKEQPSMGRSLEDPLWYQQRDSMLDNLDRCTGEERNDCIPRGDNGLQGNLVGNTISTQDHTHQPHSHPLLLNLAPRPYETATTATTATPTMKQDSSDPMFGRPLPPTPVGAAAPIEWWISPPPMASPHFPRGRVHSTMATVASPNTRRGLHQQNNAAAMDTVTMVATGDAKPEWQEAEKLRYRRIQVGTSENLVQDGHEKMTPLTTMPLDLLPGAAPFHTRAPNSVTSPLSSASSKVQTPHSDRPLPPISTHPVLKKIQNTQPCLQSGDMPLPQLTSNPVYHTGASAMHVSEGGRHGQGEDVEKSHGKQVIRYIRQLLY